MTHYTPLKGLSRAAFDFGSSRMRPRMHSLRLLDVHLGVDRRRLCMESSEAAETNGADAERGAGSQGNQGLLVRWWNLQSSFEEQDGKALVDGIGDAPVLADEETFG